MRHIDIDMWHGPCVSVSVTKWNPAKNGCTDRDAIWHVEAQVTMCQMGWSGSLLAKWAYLGMPAVSTFNNMMRRFIELL